MILLWLTLGLALLIGVALLFGYRRWDSFTRELSAKLDSSRLTLATGAYSSSDLAGLPAPVQKYFRAVLREGQMILSGVHLRHSGGINMSATSDKWKKLTSRQRVIIHPPGFDWEGRIEIMTGLTARVHDVYVAGEGMLRATIFGLIALANLRGTADIARGELMRFLAEAAWYPTALLPGQGVQWEEAGDFSARATLRDGVTTVTLLFVFDQDGLIKTVSAEARGRVVDGVAIPTPWECKFSSYQQCAGMLIPMEGEVAWLMAAGPQPYFRCRITDICFEPLQLPITRC